MWRTFFGIFAAVTALAAQEARLYVSSAAGDRLAARPPLRFEAGPPGAADAAFTIDAAARRQKIIGFGASFLEAGLICLNALDAPEQEKVLRALFDPREGAGYTAMKTPIAGTDFQSAGPWYTYDDTPGDVGMKNFSIARDLGPNGLVTYIKRARRYGDFILQAPMDYPPDWMLVDVNRKQDVQPHYYDALALYYLRYLQEYEKNGVFIDYLSLFNEPGIYTKVPYASIGVLLANHVGPLIARSGVRTKLMLSEAVERINAHRNYPLVLDDPEARKYVSVLAYHGYDYKNYDKIAELGRRYGLALWMTELCHAYATDTPRRVKLPRYDWEDGDYWGNTIFSDLEAGAGGWTYWNMILDEEGGPWLVSKVHGNPEANGQHPVVVVNRKTKEVTYTGLYYYLAHFSKFVRPGAVRIGVAGTANGIRAMAFDAPGGGRIVEVMNSRKTPARVSLTEEGKSVIVQLPPLAIATLLWGGAAQAAGAPQPPQVSVTKWPGERRAAISLTFDDGMDTHLDIARPILKKHGLNGTFYVSTGRDVWKKRLAEWKALAAEGNEIGNHTVWHPCLLPRITPHSQDFTPEKMERNVLDAARDIAEKIGAQRGLTFAYPCGNLTFGPPEEQAANTPRFFGYVAQCCFAARGYGAGGAPQDPGEMSVLNVTDLGITDSKSYIELLAMAEPALKAGAWGVFCFHGVGGEWLAISRETFDELASYLERHREIWTATFGDVVRYIQERKSLGIEAVRAGASGVELALKWPLDSRIYDLPLTLRIDFGGGRIKLVEVTPGTARVQVER